MENLAYELKDVYVVMNKQNKVIDITNNYRDAEKIADLSGAFYIVKLENYNGKTGNVIRKFYCQEYKNTISLQKIYALILILLSIISVFVLDGDITFATFMIPFMIYLLRTKKIYI